MTSSVSSLGRAEVSVTEEGDGVEAADNTSSSIQVEEEALAVSMEDLEGSSKDLEADTITSRSNSSNNTSICFKIQMCSN